jgi:hypothetical protein
MIMTMSMLLLPKSWLELAHLENQDFSQQQPIAPNARIVLST